MSEFHSICGYCVVSLSKTLYPKYASSLGCKRSTSNAGEVNL